MTDLSGASERALAGGPERHREKAREQGKLAVRERIALLLDDGSFAEEALLANWDEDGLGADGVVTGVGAIDGRPVALMANDPTVKAGSWGPKTVEKILRIQERALSLNVPMVYLVDSAGARITEQVQMFPGRRGAGRIFHNQVKLSGGGAAGVRAVRAERGGRRLHTGVLRRGDHARGQRLDVPGLAAHGRDGDRREGQPGGDGRRAHAHRRYRAAGTSSSRATRRGSRRRGATSPTCPAAGSFRRPPPRRRPRARPPTARPSTS